MLLTVPTQHTGDFSISKIHETCYSATPYNTFSVIKWRPRFTVHAFFRGKDNAIHCTSILPNSTRSFSYTLQFSALFQFLTKIILHNMTFITCNDYLTLSDSFASSSLSPSSLVALFLLYLLGFCDMTEEFNTS